MCMIDGAETGDFETHSYPKARKPHRCGECGRTIDRGETYRRDFCTYEGSGAAYKTCRHCEVGQRWLELNCGGWLFGGVGEDVREHAAEYPSIAPGLLRVANGIRRGWKRADGHGLSPVPPLPHSIKSTMQESA